MLIPTEEYARYGLDATDAGLPKRLDAIEHTIRTVTRNRFQVRGARIEAASEGGVLLGAFPLIGVGDTVQLTCSAANDGLYVVRAVGEGIMRFDRELADEPRNRVTLVRYPADVVMGAVGMLEYDLAAPKRNAGIASETLSRRSVTYRAPGAADSFAGYPLEVTAFLRPYMRACF